VQSPPSNPTPNWKQVILATHDWPDDLVVPQDDSLPEDSEAIQDSMSTKEKWEWELWRHPNGHSYEDRRVEASPGYSPVSKWPQIRRPFAANAPTALLLKWLVQNNLSSLPPAS